ncbi:MAG: hypothetical protein K2N63_02375, partial [Lachnospiraceae bacterium]|nr:hypothetical protein [Lachnospiraceae bacterium]
SFASCDNADTKTPDNLPGNMESGNPSGTNGADEEGGGNDKTNVSATGVPEEKKVQEGESGGTGTPTPGEIMKNPEVAFEILSDTRTDSEGNELVYAQYPVFSVSGEGYEALLAVLGAWNEEFKSQADVFLDGMKEDAAWYRESVDASYRYGQTTFVTIYRCDKEFVSILIFREVEEGGPHPNYYMEALNIFSQTGKLAKLSDVLAITDELKEKIKVGLRKEYPEFEFDDALLEEGIADALANETVVWYFTDGDICINFPEGSFGFGHAEGSLGVLVPVEE